MKKLLVATFLSSILIMPAFAMDDTTCAAFTAMDASAQTEAIASMETGMATDSMASDDAMADDDAMASDDAMETDDAMAPDDAMAEGGMAMTAESVTEACAANPTMTVHDAVQAMSN